ncbi:hypothetical protein BDFG_04636 [Blastomyces dermatitidis ATCC 26199]|nr:hypothetical protein BDFG_04636 [Blastomyces dermatitidis ATCC 26199]
MATSHLQYSVDQEIAHFFAKTSASRSACDTYVKEHLGGDIIPVAVQGVCSYTVYAGPKGEFVAQFRLKSLQLRMEIVNLAQTIYGHFVPQVSFRGQVGESADGKEPLYIYVMSRIRAISYLDFLLAQNTRVPENSLKFSSWRKNLVTDIAKFFARSWNAPQDVEQKYRDCLSHQYETELQLLFASLPSRFHLFIQETLNLLPAILSLPMVLLHKDFGVSNILVDETTCNLVGVVDWAEAEVAPFGLDLHSHELLISKVHLKSGLIRYDDYGTLEELFWSTFKQEAGGLSNESIRIIKLARRMGLLLSYGFTGRFANMPKPVPIQDDENGAYNMRLLDGLLINPTRFMELRD